MTIQEPEETPADQGITAGTTAGTTAVFSMKQAAEVAGISVSTLRRRRIDLVAAGADISPDGWRVPVTALVACGLIAGEGPQLTERHPRPEPRHEDGQRDAEQAQQLEELTAQVRDLEREVSEWRRRAEVAEARAEERGRALDALSVANETERMALRMLTAGTSVQAPAPRVEEPRPSTEPVAPEPQQAAPSRHTEGTAAEAQHDSSRNRGWFSRMMGL